MLGCLWIAAACACWWMAFSALDQDLSGVIRTTERWWSTGGPTIVDDMDSGFQMQVQEIRLASASNVSARTDYNSSTSTYPGGRECLT